jgi:hypothetical protein
MDGFEAGFVRFGFVACSIRAASQKKKAKKDKISHAGFDFYECIFYEACSLLELS